MPTLFLDHVRNEFVRAPSLPFAGIEGDALRHAKLLLAPRDRPFATTSAAAPRQLHDTAGDCGLGRDAAERTTQLAADWHPEAHRGSRHRS